MHSFFIFVPIQGIAILVTQFKLSALGGMRHEKNYRHD